MKRLRNCILIILCITFIFSAISAIFTGLQTLMVKADTHNYNIDYTTLSYSELDSVNSIFFA